MRGERASLYRGHIVGAEWIPDWEARGKTVRQGSRRKG